MPTARSLPRRVLILALLGATVGPLLDRAHAATGCIAYDSEVTALGVPWWVSLVYTGAALGIGLSHPAFDPVLRRPTRVAPTPARIALAFAAMAALWVATGALP